MAYILMAVHYPQPGTRDEVHARMSAMAGSMAGTPGLLEIGPWLDVSGQRVIGLSRWASREAFEQAMPGSGAPSTTVNDGERGPREYFHLTRPDGPGGPGQPGGQP